MRYLRLFSIPFFCLLSFLCQPLIAQHGPNRLLETHWQYTYTLQLETNSVVQQAGEQWRHFLYFQFDSICRQSLNGSVTASPWKLDDHALQLAFRKTAQFEVSRLNDFSLELKFSSKDGKSTYVHHFARIARENSPFSETCNTLPVVQIQTVPLPSGPAPDGELAGQPISLPASRNNGVCVELVGGGYYGGINPVQQDYITISREGRLIHEFESLQGKRLIQKVEIPGDELEKFITWAVQEQRFFELAAEYDCKTAECEKRKTVKPSPVPLRLSITYNDTRKMVAVSIWGLDKNGRRYVSYPPEIDRIVDAIQRMANRASNMK